VTQVPEYLLERSRARRAALGLGGDAPAAPAASSTDASSTDDGASPEPAATGSAVATEAPPSPAAKAPAPTAPAPPAAPLPDYVRDPGPTSGIPFWMMPILLLLPLWGIAYMGAFGERAATNLTPAQIGAQVYTSSCASCHGARGEGGVGPALAEGQSKQTFPNEPDHATWIREGSSSKKGQPYGDPARAGGQRIASTGGMPAFGGQLTDAQITAVVTYERESL
jgi:mono/diheme cytochrome c family protein